MGINQFVGRIPKASPEGVTLPRFCFSSDTVLLPILSNLLVSVVLCTVEMPPCGGIAFCIYVYLAYKKAKHTSRHRTGAGRTSENPLSAKFLERRLGEVRRIYLPRTPVNRSGWRVALRSFRRWPQF